MKQTNPLHRLAARCRIQLSFVDNAGIKRAARDETLRELLRVWGVDASSDRAAMDSLAALESAEAGRFLPPVMVTWDKKPFNLDTRLLRRARLFLLDGSTETAAPPESRADGSIPFGLYRLSFERRGEVCNSYVISAPSKAFSPPRLRGWGAFLPMYAAHSARTWGAGDFSDWQSLSREMGNLGASVVATLPLLPAFLESWKCESSPYSPASRLFWNEFYVDVSRAPGFPEAPAVQKLLQSAAFKRAVSRLQRASLVDYKQEMELKRTILLALADALSRGNSPEQAAFELFLKQRPDVRDYAQFRAAGELRQQSWHAWPARMRNGTLRRGDFDARVERYHCYVQWLAQEQMNALLHANQIEGVPRFYLDLPLGVNPDGYDVWRQRDSFAMGANVGAPPDAFFTKGQDWGFPPLHPDRIRANGYKYVFDYLRFHMRHTGLLRLDHVMGLHRLWWVPHGASAADGAYVRYCAEELYAILCLESYRHRTMLVGENLGTVPPEVNRCMARHGLRSMYVVQYAASADRDPPLPPPPRHSVASLNTHDMPMWAAFWKGLDIGDRRELGLLSRKDAAESRKQRGQLLKKLTQYLRREKLLRGHASARSTLVALLRWLAQSPAELVLLNLEDVFLEKAPQNTPGTSTERVNWRRKTSLSLERLVGSSFLRSLCTEISQLRKTRRRPR